MLIISKDNVFGFPILQVRKQMKTMERLPTVAYSRYSDIP
jgi:hypothetical protein